MKSRFMECLRKFFKSWCYSRGILTGEPQSQDDGPRADKGKEELLIEADKSNSDKEDLARICAGCKCKIGNKNYLGCMGTFFHPECCHCHECGYLITADEFFFSGKYVYHKSCIKKRTHPKCDVCHQLIPEDDILEYKCHPILSQMYCPSHEHDNTARCCSCQRLESWNTRYISLEEGRSLCLECMESAIMDTDACQPLYHAIRDFYEGMNMRIDQQIPVLLVETQALNDAIKKEKHVFKHSEARGLCLYEEQTVTPILRRPRMESHGLEGIRRQPLKVIRRCEVTAILVLYGFPRLLTGAILAHELMHAWLRLKGYRNLMPYIEEGICQVASYMWLESEVARGPTNMTSASTASSSSSQYAKPSIENKLGEFFLYQIANMASPDYGGGFRAAKVAVNRYGFRRTLDHIRLTGNIPL